MNTPLKLALILTFLLPSAHAGNEMGNGTDNFSAETGSAWFLGKEQTVRYCVESAPGFGVSLSTLENETQNAVATWLNYLHTRNLNNKLVPEVLYYTLNFEYLSRCNGKEHLTFFFGIETPEITASKTLYQNPTALALRTSFDVKLGWSKGVIWLSPPNQVNPEHRFPNWSKPGALHAFLLHELGHVFGVGHVQGTIMDALLSDQVMWNKIPEALLQKIDGKRELQPRGACEQDYPGFLGWGTGPDEDVKVFQKLTGRKAKGNLTAELVAKTLWNQCYLKVNDENGEFVFPLSVAPQMQGPLFQTATSVFKRVTEMISMEDSNYGLVLFGSLVDQQKTQRNLIIEINSSNEDTIGPVSIKEIRDGISHTIFRAKPKQ